MPFTKTTSWSSIDLSTKSLSELLVIQDKFIELHIGCVHHPKKHYEFLSKIKQCIQKQRVHGHHTKLDAQDWNDFMYMGGYDNPYFAINNMNAKLACTELKKHKKKKKTTSNLLQLA
jgi:hypothetical protein